MMGQSMSKDISGECPTIAIFKQAKIDRIQTIADRLSSNEVNENVKLLDTPAVAQVPASDSSDFKLGDRVRIKYSLSEFKSIQLQTIRWKTHFSMIHSCESIVIKRLSSFQNCISIYTASTDSVSEVYAGVLEKISNSDIEDDTPSTILTFKVNDYVLIKAEKRKTKSIDIIPSRYYKRRGRVTAVAKLYLFVTFNEKTSVKISSSLLIKSEDTSELKIPEGFHCEGLRLGQSVEIPFRSNTKQEWKEVKVINVCRDGDLLVQHGTGKDFVIKVDAVERNGTKVRIRVNPLYVQGNTVAIRSFPPALAAIFLFTETAEIETAVNSSHVRIRFGGDIRLEVPFHMLRLATAEEMRRRHRVIKSMVSNIQQGSTVIPDLGPSEFVGKQSLRLKVADEVRTTLVTPSVIVGFDGLAAAVIENMNGKRYRIPMKYLTVPEKYSAPDQFYYCHQKVCNDLFWNSNKTEYVDIMRNMEKIFTAVA